MVTGPCEETSGPKIAVDTGMGGLGQFHGKCRGEQGISWSAWAQLLCVGTRRPFRPAVTDPNQSRFSSSESAFTESGV